MRKAFQVASLVGVCVEARHSTPFVGEHSDADSIKHADGRVTNRMKAVAAPYNKYADTTTKRDLFPERRSFYSQVSEYLWGPEETSNTQRDTRGRQGKHRLGNGAELPVELVNDTGTMWVGPVYMGGSTKMDVVYDTGSDWLVTEGHTCSNC